MRRVNSRLTDIELTDQVAAPDLEVQVLKVNDAYNAQLTIRLRDGDIVHRSIAARTCDEATEAIAFVASVALDDNEIAAPDNDPSPERTHMSIVGAGANLLIEALPRATVGPELLLFWGHIKAGLWSPSLRLGAQYHRVGHVERAAGTASFQLLTSHLDLCPSQARWGAFSFRPCVHGSGGWLRAQGTETEQAKTSDRPFFTAGAALLVHIELYHYLHLMTQGSLSFPLIRDRFQFDNDVFHRAGLVSYGVGASLGVRFY